MKNSTNQKTAYKVDNAIILAAGFGSRAIPLTYETPKGLLEVFGQPMIERQIEQLLEVGVTEIYVIVGYMKETFDYLIDKYGVKLIFNPEFAVKNNLASLYVAKDYLKNSYVLVSDNYIEENMFHAYEPCSWFSCLYYEGESAEWCIKHDETDRITEITIGGADALAVVGPAFFTDSFSELFNEYLEEYYNRLGTEDFYFEHILKDHIDTLEMYTNVQTGNMHEFESLAELREYDKTYLNETNNKIMEYISKLNGVPQSEIHDIEQLKDGVTNQSFIFAIKDEYFVFRLPGTGTDKLINRSDEMKAYNLLSELDITDEVVDFDEESGIKITKYYDHARIADPYDIQDLDTSMKKIKIVHDQNFIVDNYFDIGSKIDYYQSLADGIGAIRFSDIADVKKKVSKLLEIKDRLAIPEILCHGDYAHTNVLFLKDGSCRLIDFEYSGAADPIMDVSMFCIYIQFEREYIEKAIRLYLDTEPTREELARLYLYVALGGFLWCMWAEYKQGLGQEFGEYPLIMYRYMKDYYKILVDEGYIKEIMGDDFEI